MDEADEVLELMIEDAAAYELLDAEEMLEELEVLDENAAAGRLEELGKGVFADAELLDVLLAAAGVDDELGTEDELL